MELGILSLSDIQTNPDTGQRFPTNRGFRVDRAQFEAGTQPGQAIMVGSTDELIEKIVDAHEVLGIGRFVGQVDWGGLPRPLVEESVTRYASEIAPAVQAAIGSTTT
jgi:hypothetical protein